MRGASGSGWVVTSGSAMADFGGSAVGESGVISVAGFGFRPHPPPFWRTATVVQPPLTLRCKPLQKNVPQAKGRPPALVCCGNVEKDESAIRWPDADP